MINSTVGKKAKLLTNTLSGNVSDILGCVCVLGVFTNMLSLWENATYKHGDI